MLKIEIRKHQHKDKLGNNVIIDCTNGVATYVPGTIPNNDFIDITKDCEGVNEIEFTESASDEDSFKVREKSNTSQIVVGFGSYAYIMEWLLSTPCSFLNYFDVKITDTQYNYQFKLYELKPDNIEICDGDGCKVTVPLRELDNIKSVTDKISIHDNWQGWFGGGAKQFPCVQVFKHTTAFGKGYILGAWAVANAILTVSLINTILALAGVDIMGGLNIDTMKNRAFGFGNFLPTPFIRDILQNAMAKIGYTIETPFDIGGFGENDVYAYCNGNYHTNYDDDNPRSRNLTFIFENRQIKSLTNFLNEICKLYNCVWQIEDSVLKITPLKDVNNDAIVLTIPDTDTLEDCKTFSFKKNYGAGNYEYQKDSTDAGSAEAINMYNDIVDFDGVTNNAILSGLFDKKFAFASTSFWGDNLGQDIKVQILDSAKIMLAMIMTTLISVALSFFTGGTLAAATVVGLTAAPPFFSAQGVIIAVVVAITAVGLFQLNQLQNRNNFGEGNPVYNGSIKLIGTGSIFVPRIIRLVPNTPFNNAKPIKTSVANIIKNPKYNLNNTNWQAQWSGYDNILDAFNYPLMFDANYFGNLYDNLHEATDNSLFLKQSNELRKLSLPLCENYLLATGINSDNNTLIGKNIRYKNTIYKVLNFNIKYESLTINLELKKIK